MKRPFFLSLCALVLIWTIWEGAYRAGHDAGRQERMGIISLAPEPAATPAPTLSPNFQLVPVSSGMELPEPPSLEAKVVIMPGGGRYHHPVCPYALGNTIIRISEARRRGYKPCLECGKW